MIALELGLLSHLDAQVLSSRRLLEVVLRQGTAIRERDAAVVVALTAELHAEMSRRGALETQRTELLRDAATALALPLAEVTLEDVCSLVSAGAGELARHRSAELRGLLAEVGREHGINRALMRQELSFLSHLTRLIGGDPEPGYAPPAAGATSPAGAVGGHRLLDLQA